MPRIATAIGFHSQQGLPVASPSPHHHLIIISSSSHHLIIISSSPHLASSSSPPSSPPPRLPHRPPARLRISQSAKETAPHEEKLLAEGYVPSPIASRPTFSGKVHGGGAFAGTFGGDDDAAKPSTEPWTVGEDTWRRHFPELSVDTSAAMLAHEEVTTGRLSIAPELPMSAFDRAQES